LTQLSTALPSKLVFDVATKAVINIKDFSDQRDKILSDLRELTKQECIAVMLEPLLSIPEIEEIHFELYTESEHDDNEYFRAFYLRCPRLVLSATAPDDATMFGGRFDMSELAVGIPVEFDELRDYLDQDGTPEWVTDMLRAVCPHDSFPRIQITLNRSDLQPLLTADIIDLAAIVQAVTIYID